MGKHAWTLFALGALVACGSDSKSKVDANVVIEDSPPDSPPLPDAPPDAPMHDFSCVGMPLPTTANSPIDLSGTVTEVSTGGGTALAGADVLLCKGTCVGQNKLGMTITDANGNFSFTNIATGNTPLDAYVKASHMGDRTTLVYPPIPFTATQPGIPVLTFTDSTLSLIAQVSGVTQDPAKGVLAVAVVDCANAAISDSSNVAFSVKQGGNDVQGTTTTDLGALSPMAAGTFLIWNVPAGATDISAKYMGTTQFLTRTILVQAAANTETILRPGP